jgi:hypothetical protein
MEEAKSKFEIQFVTAAKDRVGFLCLLSQTKNGKLFSLDVYWIWNILTWMIAFRKEKEKTIKD